MKPSFFRRGTAFVALALIASASFSIAAPAQAQAVPTQTYAIGRVTQLIDEHVDVDPLLPVATRFSQTVQVELTSGQRAGQRITATYTPGGGPQDPPRLNLGERVIISTNTDPDMGVTNFVMERYRVPMLLWILLAFFVAIIVYTRLQGVGAIAGLAMTLIILFGGVLPAIAAGHSPIFVSLMGTAAIAIVSMYLAHGKNQRTTIALICTLVIILLAYGLGALFIRFAHLYGLGSEEGLYIQAIGGFELLSLRGILLAGIILGTLGVLDDITTAQVAAVAAIHQANPSLDRRELYRRAFGVGREHIASLVNTLALAYIGASFPLFLLFTRYDQPWWLVLNSEPVAEEVIRTLVGSFALVLAVPLTTTAAAWWYRHRSFR